MVSGSTDSRENIFISTTVAFTWKRADGMQYKGNILLIFFGNNVQLYISCKNCISSNVNLNETV
jgi:hypothetical protein